MSMNIILVLMLVLGIIYMIVAISSYTHVVTKDKWVAISPWWSFSPSDFDDIGKQRCKLGRLIVYAIIILNVIFLIYKT